MPDLHAGGFDLGSASGFHSGDCLIFCDDSPGDTTIRPIPPERLAHALAEREKLVRYGLLPPLPAKPTEPPGGQGSPSENS